jgi:hypothetical protein
VPVDNAGVGNHAEGMEDTCRSPWEDTKVASAEEVLLVDRHASDAYRVVPRRDEAGTWLDSRNRRFETDYRPLLEVAVV